MSHDYDVVVIGGGPAGWVLGSLLAQAGHSALILERDIHPRDHVGESFTPSSNAIWERIGFLAKMEEAGFVHKPGALWTAPRALVGQFVAIHLTEFPIPGSPIPYTFNVERDVFDTMLIRHAHELGAKVLQGVGATKVLFDGERATGVTVKVADGWERDVTARFVVDASGRRSILANQLGLRRNDPEFNQFAIWSWFRGVEPIAEGDEGYQGLHAPRKPRPSPHGSGASPTAWTRGTTSSRSSTSCRTCSPRSRFASGSGRTWSASSRATSTSRRRCSGPGR